ncbi:MAG: hypothetical protein DBX97_02880 [Collinsella tanakaei]|nr:MAG: hypothetical protein DBX97_02880 [Collinsella tanakaei]
MAFMDDDGLRYLWSKIKGLFNRGITSLSVNGKVITYTKGNGTTGSITTQDTNTTYAVVSKMANGLAPKLPDETATTKYLRQDGTWAVPPNTVYSVMSGATETAAGKAGLVPAPAVGSEKRFLMGSGEWSLVTPDISLDYTDGGATIITLVGVDGVTRTLRETPGATAAGPMTRNERIKLNGFQEASNYALKSDIVGMYKYKGSVTDASKLPTTGQTAGDVYNIEAASVYGGAGMNVAWNGSAWDPLGEIFTITAITNAEIDAICV